MNETEKAALDIVLADNNELEQLSEQFPTKQYPSSSRVRAGDMIQDEKDG